MIFGQSQNLIRDGYFLGLLFRTQNPAEAVLVHYDVFLFVFVGHRIILLLLGRSFKSWVLIKSG